MSRWARSLLVHPVDWAVELEMRKVRDWLPVTLRKRTREIMKRPRSTPVYSSLLLWAAW